MVTPRAMRFCAASGFGIHEGVEPFGEVEVVFGDAAFAVGAEDDADFVEADVHVGMMIGILGEFGDAVHEINSLLEVVELENANDGFPLHVPFGQVFDGFLDFLGAEN